MARQKALYLPPPVTSISHLPSSQYSPTAVIFVSERLHVDAHPPHPTRIHSSIVWFRCHNSGSKHNIFIWDLVFWNSHPSLLGAWHLYLTQILLKLEKLLSVNLIGEYQQNSIHNVPPPLSYFLSPPCGPYLPPPPQPLTMVSDDYGFIVLAAGYAATHILELEDEKKRNPCTGRVAVVQVCCTVQDIYSLLGETYFRRAYYISYESFWRLHTKLGHK